MTILARAHIFTGNPNPEWELSENDAATFNEALLELERFRRFDISPPDGPIPGLGYRGFSLQVESEHGCRAISCFRGRVSIQDSFEWIQINPIHGMPVDKFLAGTLYKRPERAWVRRYVVHRLRLDALGTGCCTCSPQGVGDDGHDDGLWNAQKDFNNCYSYALNLGPENNSAAGIRRPGMKKYGTCQTVPEYTFCEPATPGFVDMRLALVSDGLSAILQTPVPCPRPEPTLHYIAAFLAGQEFHFYRQHTSGRWSYAAPGDVVQHLTPGGCWIVDPRQDYFDPAHQPPGGVFCGFYLVDADALDIC